MIIRDAVADDMDDLIALNGEVQSIHVSLFPDIFRDTDASALADWFKAQMDDPATAILLATENDHVLAYLIMCMLRRDSHVFCHACNCAYVNQICISSEYRNQGIAGVLIKEARQRAKQNGMKRLELDVWSENKAAKAAFQSIGFTTYKENMALKI